MIIIRAKLFSNPTMQDKFIGQTRTGFTEFYAQSLSADFEPATWLLFATNRLVLMVICAKLFSNPTMHNKVMSWTRSGFTEVYVQSKSADCDLDL